MSRKRGSQGSNCAGSPDLFRTCDRYGARRCLEQVAAAVDTGVSADAGAVDAAKGCAADAVDAVLDIRNEAHAVSLAMDIAGAAVVHPVEEMNTLPAAARGDRVARTAAPTAVVLVGREIDACAVAAGLAGPTADGAAERSAIRARGTLATAADLPCRTTDAPVTAGLADGTTPQPTATVVGRGTALIVAEELARWTRAARAIDAEGRTAVPAATGCARGAARNLVRIQ